MMSALLLLGVVSAQAQSRDFDKIVESGVLRVGLISQPPFVKFDPGDQGWTGPSYELAKLLAESLNIKLEIVESTYQNIIPALQAEKIDVALSPVYATPKRALAIWFSEPYRYERGGLLLRKSDLEKFAKIDDFDKPDVTIVTNIGSASEADAKRTFPNANIKGMPAEGLMLEVQSNRATAWYADITTLNLAAQRNEDWAAVWNPDYEFNSVPMAFMQRKGDLNLLYFLNTWLNYYITLGNIQEIDAAGGLLPSRRSRTDD